ncbi:LPS assembly lipoprotein LptE [Sulfurospirillum multivorans]|uniref:Lipopolysaccharide-assembly protein LptE n=2 Tax=Sulfurospirillum multivorans TaxID=66821 RepID=A0AA86AN31_SULMK|nr:LPS assembly lipoprotein LptE [Sulfurospirillum multivorans]AHJ13509.1 putative lipopolysaccharide-assembly protein LptE [Sulfurospirillum multivorans DSM 12446]QEH06999.1 putative lipopolysaccharide-assembly protein LptE [Sulfurospirillum multivorans]
MKQLFLGLLIIAFISGCGYKPSSYYAKSALGDKIYAEVTISRQDPRNSVLIKDAVNEAIVSRFSGKLVSKEQADSVLHVRIQSISFSPTVYDTYGYVIAYKTTVVLAMNYENAAKKVEKLTATGEYDFSIEANSVISDTNRFEAIRYAASDALDEFVSKIAIKGLRNGNNN